MNLTSCYGIERTTKYPWIVEAFTDISIDQYKEIRKKVESSGSDYLRSLLYELSNY